MKLTVHYWHGDGRETEHREGVNFRWTYRKGALSVTQLDSQDRIVWAKFYARPISAEIEKHSERQGHEVVSRHE